MSELERLIQEHCQNGVEFRPLSDISKIVRGERITKKDLVENGEFIVMSGGVQPMGRYTKNNRDGKTITISSYGAAGYIGFVEEPFWANDVCLSIFPNEDIVLNKYLYYALKKQQDYIYSNTTKAIPDHIPTKFLEGLLIPVPPLEVQREIVRILDNFTELTAELAARKQQLEFYQEKLICETTKTVKLSEICDIYLGLTATPNYVESGVKFISAQNTSSDYLDLDNTKFISEEDYKKATSNAKPKRGDVLFTRVGSNLGHPVIVETDEKLCIFVSLGFLRPKDLTIVDNRHLKHWMNTDLFWAQVRKNVHGAAKVNLNTGWLKEFEIQLPDIEVQKKVCDQLDLLDRICTDFSSGLPAEIEARQKQYEYYRDKLLTFKQLA